jgi:hypothetical protein
MNLEQQLKTLAEIGFTLNDGINIDDLLYSFDRQSYEKKPFDLILFMLGTEVEHEPWGRPFCSTVWNFDTECIYATGDYVKIAKRLCQVASRPDCLQNVSDFVDLESRKAWLKYRANNVERSWTVEVNNDWVDQLAISYLMADIECDGRRFYFKDNGQSMVLYYLDSSAAGALNRLSNGALRTVLPE